MKTGRSKTLVHLSAGIVILLESNDKFEEGDSKYIYFLFAGIIFILFAILHLKLKNKFHFIESVFFIIEGFLFFFLAYESFENGGKVSPWIFIFFGLIDFYISIFEIASKNKLKH